MAPMLLIIWNLLRAALQQALIALVTERLMKDIIIVALEKLSKKTDNHVDDDIVLLLKRALYPDFEAGQPPSLPENSSEKNK